MTSNHPPERPTPLPPGGLTAAFHRDMARDFDRAARWAAVIAAVIAATAIVLGWGLGVTFFERFYPGFPAMVPETALAVLAVALAILALAQGRTRLVLPGALAALAIVAATQMAQGIGRDLEPDNADRMSIASSFGLILLAVTTLVRWRVWGRPSRTATTLATVGLGFVFIPLLGYLFNADALFLNPLYTRMAILTVVTQILLFGALLMLAPQAGWVATLAAPQRGGAVVRGLIPFIVIGPIVLTGLALFASRRAVLPVDLRAAALTFSMILTTSAAALYFARLVNASERREAELVAERLRAERAQGDAEVAVVRSQKEQALGKLVGGVAHDFNNTLTVILGNLHLMQEGGDAAAQGEYLAEAVSATEHAAHLTRQLLAYSRKSRLAPEVVRMDDLMAPSMTMFRRICPANIPIRAEMEAPRTQVRLDVPNFQQALLNILINARDAQPRGGRITVHTEVEWLETDRVVGRTDGAGLPGGRYVTVRVTDEGPGIPEDLLEKAAEPFFTTKGVGEGSGLGLSVVYGFCRQSGGGLILENRREGGLSVKMAFPVHGEAVAEIPAPVAVAPVEAVPAYDILVVDDQPPVAGIIARQLEVDGHRVRVAPDAMAAMALLAAGPLPQIVLTDVVMPGQMQGNALTKAIRQLYPGVQVVLMSGYDSDKQRAEIEGIADLRFLQKPLDRATLRRVIAELMRPPAPPG